MTNYTTWGSRYLGAITNLVNDIQNLKLLQDEITQDANLLTNVANVSANFCRTDLTVNDWTNASGAIVQIIFAYDSGNPTQKSFLFKML